MGNGEWGRFVGWTNGHEAHGEARDEVVEWPGLIVSTRCEVPLALGMV